MKYIILPALIMLLSGCSYFPKINIFGKSDNISTNAAKVASNETAKSAISKIEEAELKAEQVRKELEEKYSKVRADMIKAYEDARKKDLENFYKIAELNYGIYHVTQEKKKIDINTTIAHLRSKEIMTRTDKLTDDDKSRIQKEVADEKTKTIDELYIKYKSSIELANKQKEALDAAEALIAEKEKEKAALKEATKQAIQKLETDKLNEIERLKKEAEDNVKIAKEAQKAEMLGWIVKALIGVGIVILVIGLLMKSIVFIISGIFCLGLAYGAAILPFWIIASAMGLIMIAMIFVNPKDGKIAYAKPTKNTQTIET